ncbi:MAG: glycosyltransferase [Schleiferiaceae bacterium]|nr:glycosyltransferase [Schleiferiaceae bacterium]
MTTSTVLEWVFWIALFGVVITYILYPLILVAFDHQETTNSENTATQPPITILLAAHNEARIIAEKIKSTFHTDYPKDKVTLIIGTDACTDDTDKIIAEMREEYPNIIHITFQERTGKPGILNALVPLVSTPYIIGTDANVLFTKTTLSTLMARFNHQEVGIVAGHIRYTKEKAGIAKQERSYLQFENRIKLAESNRYGMAMGAEGGCYAIKTELFPELPPLTIVDDFYVTMHVLKRGKKVLFEPNAIGLEDVSIDPEVEYNRKARISAGNWQNLGHFGDIVLADFFPLGAIFFFHKILRWLTPFLLLLALICALLLMTTSVFYGIFAAGTLGVFALLFLENAIGIKILKSDNWKFIRHFIYMNLALLAGFIRYLKGVKTNIWQRTQRNER